MYVRAMGSLETPNVTFDQCQAIINHQATAGIDTQFACASKGWHGNAAWPIPLPPSVPLPPATQPTIIQPPVQPLSPLLINPTPPALNVETVNTIPSCEGSFDQWISDNKALALAAVVAVYVLR